MRPERRQSRESRAEEGEDREVKERLSLSRCLGADCGGEARSRERIRWLQQERRHEVTATWPNDTLQGCWEGKTKGEHTEGANGPWEGCERDSQE